MRLFSSKKPLLLGLDISSTCLKMVEVIHQQGVYHLKSYGFHSLDQGVIVDDVIVDSDALGSAIAILSNRLNITSKYVSVAVAGTSVITKLIEVEADLTEIEIEAQIHIDADQYIPYPLNEVNLDFEVLDLSLSDPTKVQVLLVASRSENIDQRVNALDKGGLIATVVDIQSHATERAFQLTCDSLPNYPSIVALVDIGHVHTNLYIAKEGEFVYSREQHFGGAQLTESIQHKYGLTFDEATQAKHTQTKYRQAALKDYQQDVFIPFLDDLILHMSRFLQFYLSSSDDTQVDHILLCGGSAVLNDLPLIVQNKLNIPVSRVNPFQNMTVGNSIDLEHLAFDAPSLMMACGLALRIHD